jgi:hypothetical protein
MHHMAANWSPLAQEQRHQLCYGVWGVVGPGTARQFLDSALAVAGKVRADYDWRLVGAWWTAMRNEDEAVLLWSIPTWESWARVEQDLARGVDALSADGADAVLGRERILLAAAPSVPSAPAVSPLAPTERTGWTDPNQC